MQKYLLVLFALLSFGLQAQILDDSTHQIYNTKTVDYILEKDIINNRDIKNHPDTTLADFQFVGAMQKTNWMFQDLGNIGTSAKLLTFEPITDITTLSGFDGFQLYAPDYKNFKYYNTKSPYTKLFYIQWFNGFSRLDFSHSQNINPRLNITFNLSKYNAAKQYGNSTKEEQLVNHWNYDFTSNYTSKDKKYLLLATFYHFNHKQNEQGGIIGGDLLSVNPDSLQKNYSNNYSTQYQKGVYSKERWNNVHIYQQYKLANGFQLYYIGDYQRQKYFYLDNFFQTNKTTATYNLPNYNGTVDSLNQNIFYRTISNQFGIKGRYKGFDYRTFARLRNYAYSQKNVNNPKIAQSEFFVGGQLAYYLKDSVNRLIVDAEFGVGKKFSQLINANLNILNFEANLNISVRPAGLFYQNFNNNVISWENGNLNSINQLHLTGNYTYKIGNFELKPEFKFTAIDNYTYLNNEMKPTQVGLNITNFGGKASFRVRNILISNYFLFSNSGKTEALHLPKIMNTFHIEGRVHYAKSLKINLGLDAYLKSKYLGDAYSPMLQHYYYQNTANVWERKNPVMVLDPYMAFNLKQVRIALKYTYFNQFIFGKGFYTTPYYLNNPAALYLKVDWPLFD